VGWRLGRRAAQCSGTRSVSQRLESVLAALVLAASGASGSWGLSVGARAAVQGVLMRGATLVGRPSVGSSWRRGRVRAGEREEGRAAGWEREGPGGDREKGDFPLAAATAWKPGGRRLSRERRARLHGPSWALGLGLGFSFFSNFKNTFLNNPKIHNNYIKIIYK
jgi:hypothetical protein